MYDEFNNENKIINVEDNGLNHESTKDISDPVTRNKNKTRRLPKFFLLPCGLYYFRIRFWSRIWNRKSGDRSWPT